MSRQRPISVVSNGRDDPIGLMNDTAWRTKSSTDAELEFQFSSLTPWSSITVGYYNCNEMQVFIQRGNDWSSVSDAVELQSTVHARIRINKGGIRQVKMRHTISTESDRIKIILRQCEKSRQAGAFGLDMIEFYGGKDEVPLPIEKPKEVEKKTDGKVFWKKFKNDIEKFCQMMSMTDFEELPSLLRGEFFLEAFEASRSEGFPMGVARELTVDEAACFRERVQLHWVEILSLRADVIKERIKKSEETMVLSSSDSDDCVEVQQTPVKKRKLSHIKVSASASPSRHIPSTSNGKSSGQSVVHDLTVNGKNRKEPIFQKEMPESAQCPLCEKHFDVDYIMQHSSSCMQDSYLTKDERREINADDITNRRYMSRKKINPITGREECSRQDNWSGGPFRPNEQEIQNTQLEAFQRELNKSPQPVRTMYPHFDRPSEPIQKCPICAMTYLQRELSDHTSKCAERTFG